MTKSIQYSTKTDPYMKHDPASVTGDPRPVFEVFSCRARLTADTRRRLGEAYPRVLKRLNRCSPGFFRRRHFREPFP